MASLEMQLEQSAGPVLASLQADGLNFEVSAIPPLPIPLPQLTLVWWRPSNPSQFQVLIWGVEPRIRSRSLSCPVGWPASQALSRQLLR